MRTALHRLSEMPSLTTESLIALSGYASSGELPPKKYLSTFTNLMPPEYLNTLTPLDVLKLIRVEKGSCEPMTAERQTALTQLLVGNIRDEVCQKYWPARTKTDLALRRSRFHDLYYAFKQKPTQMPCLWDEFVYLTEHLDYIHALNLGWYLRKQGPLGLLILRKSKAHGWLNSLDSFLLAGKQINDVVKKMPCKIEVRQLLAEMPTLTGYRNLPFPGFDVIKEAKDLAQGGGKRPVDNWMHKFRNKGEEINAKSTPQFVEYISLEDYIRSWQWVTSGSSSIGKVIWGAEGEENKFKARKNFLPYIATADDLIIEAQKSRLIQNNSVLIKNETGKLRLAVAGDIGTYLVQSWLFYLSGHAYKTWPTNTMDESLLELTRRQYRVQAKLRRGYSLPFDYAAFDHQVNTNEIQLLTKLYLSNALRNTPIEHYDEVASWLTATVEAFNNAWLTVKHEGKEHTFRVTGGLMSGLRITTLLGNYWNAVMTGIAEDMVRGLGVEGDFETMLRGDDSSIVSTNYAAVLLHRICYATINAVGNDSKYGIHANITEFLRNWITPDHVYGLPNRVINGLTQRKPWSSDPWTPESSVGAVAAACKTLCRRGTATDFDALFHPFAVQWSRLRSLSVRWLELPISMGGFGVSTWKHWVPDTTIPRFKMPTVEIKNLSATAVDYVQALYPTVFKVTKTEAQILLKEKTTSLMASDDVRDVAPLLRRKYNSLLKKMSVPIWRRITIQTPFSPEYINTHYDMLTRLDGPDQLALALRRPHGLYGRWAKVKPLWDDAGPVFKIRKWSRREWFQASYPGFMWDLSDLERKGLHRTAALDILFGTAMPPDINIMNPLAMGVIKSSFADCLVQAVSRPVHWRREDWTAFVTITGLTLARGCSRSAVYQRVFAY